jgi:hypothetical protein
MPARMNGKCGVDEEIRLRVRPPMNRGLYTT